MERGRVAMPEIKAANQTSSENSRWWLAVLAPLLLVVLGHCSARVTGRTLGLEVWKTRGCALGELGCGG